MIRLEHISKAYEGRAVLAVSYTHLDVYKRQVCIQECYRESRR